MSQAGVKASQMAFRTLFFKPTDRSTAEDDSGARERLPAAAAPSFIGPSTPLEEATKDDGPIHLPHRGLAPFRPQTLRADESLHIPYRGLAPFRPARAERTSEDALMEAPSAAVANRETRAPAEGLQANPVVARGLEKVAPLLKPPLQQTSTVVFEEVRERPRESKRAAKPRIPRHSSGWAAMLKHLKEEPNLRVLDIGPTSPNNINFLTGMGHSVYMADVVQEALEGHWAQPGSDEQELSLAVNGFCEEHFNFHHRCFDVVLLWTAIDYLPDSLIPAVIARIHESTEPGGQLLAFFHSRTTGADAAYCRYHLVDSSNIDMQENEPHPVLRVCTNREIERLFKDFSGCKFFLARDNVYEVIVTR
jgi:hypothetical protein